MSGVVWFVVAVLIACGGLIVLAARRPTIRVGHQAHAQLTAMHRHAARWRLAGLVAGAVGATLCLSLGDALLGRLVSLAPAVVVGGVLVGTIIGETTARPLLGPTRQASIQTRRLSDLVGGQQIWTSVACVVMLVGVLNVGLLNGSADDLGRAGRSLRRSCQTTIDGVVTQVGEGRGPWPGSYYAVPLGLAMLLLAVLAGLALRAITLRPSAGLESAGLDLTTRRWAVGSVLTACRVGCLLVAGPLALLMAEQLQQLSCRAPGDGGLALGLTVLGIPATALGWSLLCALFLPPRLVADDIPPAMPQPPSTAGVPVR